MNLIYLFLFFCLAAGSQELKQIQVPVHPTHEGSPTFTYKYRVFPSYEKSETTVIMLNGGPGATLLELPNPYQQTDGSPNPFPLGGVGHKSLNIIYTDQRGSGLNNPALPISAYTVENMAYDVAALIKNEDLQNYIIYGSSFGTVHATYTAHLIEKLNLPKPKAVVLEGVLGRSPLGGGQEYVAAFSQEWERVKKILGPYISAALTQRPLPFYFSSRAWAMYIYSRLILGNIPKVGHILEVELAPLVTGNPAQLSELYYKLLPFQMAATSPLSAKNSMPYVVGCRELFGSGGAGFFDLQQGRLINGQPIDCGDIEFVGYDSADLPITTPLFYFQGPHDAASPLSSARYHFENQTQSRRTLVLVEEAAHGPLTLGLRSLGVSEKLWQAIAEGNWSQCQWLLESTNWPISTETRD